ncbi:MAG: fasciclin domain-containing protein [Gemmatimonadaceae bacterium]
MKRSKPAKATTAPSTDRPIEVAKRSAAAAPSASASPYRSARRSDTDLVDTAADTGRLDTLVKAITASGLAYQLRGRGPFTLFAPTDEAFARMPKADLDALLANRPKLARVINFHLVRETVKAPTAGSPTSATTVHGEDLQITAKDGGFRVNGARVVRTDIRASNGVIHAIDTVLLPS